MNSMGDFPASHVTASLPSLPGCASQGPKYSGPASRELGQWLVVEPRLWNIWKSVGWDDDSQYLEKRKCSKPPTSIIPKNGSHQKNHETKFVGYSSFSTCETIQFSRAKPRSVGLAGLHSYAIIGWWGDCFPVDIPWNYTHWFNC